MTTAAIDTAAVVSSGDSRGSLRSVVLFASIAVPAGWVLLGVPLLIGLPVDPFVLATLVVMVVTASVLVRREGRGRVLRLVRDLARLPRPRSIIVLAVAIPALTVAVAAALGALALPRDEDALLGLIVQTVTGLVLVNLLEEMVWMGFVQRRLAGRLGLVRGALVTAALFVALHLPLGLAGWADGPGSVAFTVAVLLVAGVALRLLIGAIDVFGRSLLVAALVHASFNLAGSLVLPAADWIRYSATGMIAAVLVVVASRQRRAASTSASRRSRASSNADAHTR